MTKRSDEDSRESLELLAQRYSTWLEHLRWISDTTIERSHWPRNLAIGLLALQGTYFSALTQVEKPADDFQRVVLSLATVLLLIGVACALAALWPREYGASNISNHIDLFFHDRDNRRCSELTVRECDEQFYANLLNELLQYDTGNGRRGRPVFSELNSITSTRTKLVGWSAIFAMLSILLLAVYLFI